MMRDPVTRFSKPMQILVVAGVFILGWLNPAQSVAQNDDSVSATNRRLATVLARYANEILISNDLNVSGLNVALDLLLESGRLDPYQADTFRKLIILALAIDREELLDEATRNLLKIVPDDKRAQLARLEVAIDKFNTTEEQINALEQMLQPEVVKSLGPEISSRLAFRLADIHRRRGDLQQFGRWLGESIALDPTYSDAVGIATGFLRDRVPDHIAYVELLIGLLTADLTDDNILSTLNAYLLATGAYEAAERMIMMRMNQHKAGGIPFGSSIYGKLALAQWGQGKRTEALETIRARREELNNLYETMAQLDDPSRSPLELAQLKAPLPPQLAMIQATLLAEENGSDEIEAIEDLIMSSSYEGDLSNMAAENPRSRSQRLLHIYWSLLWLDADKDLLNTRLEEIKSIDALSDQALARISAWQTLREGNPEAAADMFRDDQTGHVMSAIGLALALIDTGHDRDAAEILYSIWNSYRGQVAGLWARDQLESLLGSKIPIPEDALKMNEMIAELPLLLDRVPEDPRLAVTLRIIPREDIYKPYDPIIVDLEISNNTPLPLAIDRDGPIRELLLMEAKVEVPYAYPPNGSPIVIEINGKLRLMPFEKLLVPVDLRRYWVGTIIDRHPLYGASIDLKAILNFRMQTGNSSGQASQLPGLMGLQTEFNNIRVDGQRVNANWANRVIQDLQGEDISPNELVEMALLSHVVSSNSGSLVSDPLPEDIITASVDTIIDLYPRLDPNARAWLLAVIGKSPRLDSIWNMASRSSSVVVQFIQLMRLLDASIEIKDLEPLLENALLISALNSNQKPVRSLAEWIEGLAENQRDERLKILTNDDGAE